MLFRITRRQLLTQLTMLLAFSPLCFAQSPSYERSPQFDAICSSHEVPNPIITPRIYNNRLYDSMRSFINQPEIARTAIYDTLRHVEQDQYHDVVSHESNIDQSNFLLPPPCSRPDGISVCTISSCEVSGSYFCNSVNFQGYIASKKIAVHRHTVILRRLFTDIMRNSKVAQTRRKARRFRSQLDTLFTQLLRLPESFGVLYDCPRN